MILKAADSNSGTGALMTSLRGRNGQEVQHSCTGASWQVDEFHFDRGSRDLVPGGASLSGTTGIDPAQIGAAEKSQAKSPAAEVESVAGEEAGTPPDMASLSMLGSLPALASISMGVTGPLGEAIGGAIYKGNLHCHTWKSDGGSSPEAVVKWYRDQGYDFLAITDHNTLTMPEVPDDEAFLLIPGEEVSDSCEGKPLHVNGLNITKTIEPQKGGTIQETLQRDVDAIVGQGGIAQLNHPFWQWSYDERHVLPLDGVNLLEVHNGTRECNQFPAGSSQGTEGMWDSLLSQGKVIYATANDDAHSFEGTYDPWHHWPGRGWVMVQAPDLTRESVLSSLEEGRFYATTGVTLSEVAVTDADYRVKVEPHGDFQYTIQFIGKEGRVLKQVEGTEARYAFTRDELYVRARVVSSDGEYALTQPYFLNNDNKAAA